MVRAPAMAREPGKAVQAVLVEALEAQADPVAVVDQAGLVVMERVDQVPGAAVEAEAIKKIPVKL